MSINILMISSVCFINAQTISSRHIYYIMSKQNLFSISQIAEALKEISEEDEEEESFPEVDDTDAKIARIREHLQQILLLQGTDRHSVVDSATESRKPSCESNERDDMTLKLILNQLNEINNNLLKILKVLNNK